MRSLKGFILIAAVAASMILFGVAYGVTSWISRRYVQQDAEEQASFLAEQTFSSMFQIMRRGWDREDVEDFLNALERSTEGNRFAIEVFRGELVEERFGPIEQPALSPAVREAFRTGERVRVQQENRLTFVHPLQARSECLECHTNAEVGDTLGVITVEEDLGPAIQAAQQQFRTAFLIIALVPLVAAVGVAWIISRRIDRSVDSLSSSIERVNTVSDLREVEQHIPDVGFTELNTLAAQVHELSSRLQGIAVDKDLLEFEIRLLEKFVITSDVVQDWRDYIKNLLWEINGVIEAYSLFSLFKVDEEVYDLEVFWLYPPTEETRSAVTERIHQAIAENPYFGEATEVAINHNVVDSEAGELTISPEELDVQTKSLFLESPKIGGIVGIGVNSATTQDRTRILVTESILSTLLNVVGSVRAISKYTRDLEFYASRDPLTNLYNQRTFREFLHYEVGRAERQSYSFGLVLVDLDNFKSINDRFGHPLGDQFLQRFADALNGVLREGDVWARYGGDEFAGLIPEAGIDDVWQVAQRLLEAADKVIMDAPDGTRVRATVSVGIAMFPDHATDANDLFLFADNMMYRAKTQGKHRIGMPTEQDVVEDFREQGEKSHLVQEAIETAGVIPYYQPICFVADGSVLAHEVLVRIQSEGKVLGAAEFIEHAERMGVVHQMDYLVMDQAFADAQASGYDGLLFINLAPRALVLEEFLARTRELVSSHAIDPSRVVFELTERDTVRNLNLLVEFINDLKRDGFQFAVDDFGSGFSSFHYLKRLPIDYVKIEGEFVANMARDPQDHALVKSMATLTAELGIRTIAEIVEEEEVLEAVRGVGIPFAQGFYLGRPSPNLG